MLPRQKLFAILISIGLILLIFDLVRRRKLREEYSWLWMLLGAAIFIMSIWDGMLIKIGSLIGIIGPQSVLFFFGVFFIVLICLHFCVKISTLTNQIKKLAQKLAIIESSKDLLEYKDNKI
ncbi:hypothetical protein ES706_05430 [subsurface metagenome]